MRRTIMIKPRSENRKARRRRRARERAEARPSDPSARAALEAANRMVYEDKKAGRTS